MLARQAHLQIPPAELFRAEAWMDRTSASDKRSVGTLVRMHGGLPRLVCLLLLMLSALSACTQDNGPVHTPPQVTTEPIVDSVRYVSPTGDDSWAGTKAQPWRTLARALPALYAGQVLYVRGGRYREQLTKLTLHEGTPDKPIVVTNFPGERPVVRGLVWLRQPTYWKIHGLNVTWDPAIQPPPRSMVKVTGGVGWTWRNSEIWGSRGAANMLVVGYGAKEPAHWSIFQNCIHDLRPPNGATRSSNLAIGDMVAAGPGHLKRNLIFNDVGQQNVALGSAAGGPTDVTIQYNTIYGGDVAASFAGDTTGVHIERNILGGVSSGVLIRWHSPLGSDNVVRQNLGVQADRFFRPSAEPVIGPGNILVDDVAFPDVSTCGGFRSNAAAAVPYGRYAVG